MCLNVILYICTFGCYNEIYWGKIGKLSKKYGLLKREKNRRYFGKNILKPSSVGAARVSAREILWPRLFIGNALKTGPHGLGEFPIRKAHWLAS